MTWVIDYIPESAADVRSLDGSQKKEYFKALDKVQLNPLPATEGGYGKPLGNKGGRKLTGLCKIKLKRSGLRVVYKVVRVEEKMIVVVVGMRADDEVYDLAYERLMGYPELL